MSDTPMNIVPLNVGASSLPQPIVPLTLPEVEEFLGRCVSTTGSEEGDPPMAELVRRLREAPVAPGSVVMIAVSNSIRLLRFFFAVSLAGHVPLLLAPSTPTPRVRELAVRLGATALIGTRGKVRTAAIKADHVTELCVGAEMLLFDSHPTVRHNPGQVILLTSGTSGMATGCLHDLSALLRNARRHARSIGLTGSDTVLVTLPIYYSFALVAQVLASLTSGAMLFVSGPPFSVAAYNGDLARHGITVSSLTPLLVEGLLSIDGTLPPALRTLSVGGQSLASPHTARLFQRNPALALYLTYGLTEAGPRVSTLAAHREPPERYSSAGLPMDGVRLTFRDAGRGPLAQEVLVTSDTVYRKRLGVPPENSARRGGLIAVDTVATGDLGYLDNEGYLHLRGRLSDFAMIRGEKVSLASVRAIAATLPGVVRVVARVDQRADALSLELFVKQPSPNETSLRRTLFSLLAPHERPAHLMVHSVEAGVLHK
ncbi:class I adenylate-forming enzyme family protein [Streptomyces sp. NPDC087908]|uniref:class I adenylate-forming enzyme family protein n=1 Tax=Streptomyces sp. NPDC087908 TaxID=3365820 RepID=UPI0038285668